MSNNLRAILRLILTILLIFSAIAELRAQREPDDVVRINATLVNVFVSVLDRNNNFLNALVETDFELYEDGLRQPVVNFETKTNRPLSIAILIDTSGSQKNVLSDEKLAAQLFTRTIVKNEYDRVAVISFAGDSFLEQHLTNRVSDVESAIDRIVRRGLGEYKGRGTILPAGAKPVTGSLTYTSAVWDAIWLTCTTTLSGANQNTRNVIVIMTDGEDSSSRATLEDAIRFAIQANTLVYAIGVGDTEVAEGVNRRNLKQLSQQTGGKFFQPKSAEELQLAFRRIESELRSQYLLTYKPVQSAKSSYREIRLDITNKDLKKRVRALSYRTRYFFRGDEN